MFTMADKKIEVEDLSKNDMDRFFATHTPTRAGGRSGKGRALLDDFASSRKAMRVLHFNGNENEVKKERDNTAIAVKNAMTEEESGKLWVRKIRGQNDVLVLIDLTQATDQVKSDYADEQKRIKARMAGRAKKSS